MERFAVSMILQIRTSPASVRRQLTSLCVPVISIGPQERYREQCRCATR